MKRILLTGAGKNGFIGRNLKEDLCSKYELYTPSSSELDLCDTKKVEAYIKEHKIITVIHSAVHNPRNRGGSDEMRNNLLMFYNLERLAGELDRLIYFGSGAEFDKRMPVEMVTEEDICRSLPTDDYGICKYIMNKTARASDNVYNLRLFGIFGKYEYWPLKFISNLCCKAIYDLPLTIRQNCYFDFLYIPDLAPVVQWAVNASPQYHDYNICTGTPVDLLTIARTVNKVAGKKLPVTIHKEGFNLPYNASNARIKNELEFIPTSIFNAVEDLYKWYYDNRHMINLAVLKESR
jgi:UDP-glucose 4-epimerase